jgi:hypothetical protein
MAAPTINKVLVLGRRLMGRQIALQCALFDVDVTIYCRSEISRAGPGATWSAMPIIWSRTATSRPIGPPGPGRGSPYPGPGGGGRG